MSEQTQGRRRPWWLYLTALLTLLIAARVGWMYEHRRGEEKALEQRAQVAEAKRIHDEVAFNGGPGVKIRAFAADPPTIRRGGKAGLCYNVVSAAEVSIDPKPADETWPSIARCVDVSPKKTTTYTLTAKDDKGHSVQAQTEIVVR